MLSYDERTRAKPKTEFKNSETLWDARVPAKIARAMAGTRVLSLNTCLLPTRLRWIFRAHRGAESLAEATARVAGAIADAHRAFALDVVHLQEVFMPASLRELAAALRPLGFVHATDHTPCGLATLSRRPLATLHVRERACWPFTPKGWAALRVDGPSPGCAKAVHVNCHFASELDGSHAARLAQAREVGAWVSAALARGAGGCAERALVIGDLNEPSGAGAARLAATLGAPPLAGEAEETYRWLGGLVRARLDRAFLFERDDCAGVGPHAPAGAPAGPVGVELVGVVLRGLADVSDHLPLVVRMP